MILRFTSLCGKQHACDHDPYVGSQKYPNEKTCPEHKSLPCSQKVFLPVLIDYRQIQRGLNGGSGNHAAITLWLAIIESKLGEGPDPAQRPVQDPGIKIGNRHHDRLAVILIDQFAFFDLATSFFPLKYPFHLPIGALMPILFIRFLRRSLQLA